VSTKTVPTADAGPLSRLPHQEAEATFICIAASADEGDRQGEVALVAEHDRPQVLGREDDPDDRDRLRFFRHRPGTITPTSPLTAAGISRLQLVFRRQGSGQLTVHNAGQCPLMVNGESCDNAPIYPGDLLYLRRQLLLLCVQRPAALPPLRHFERAWMGVFGQADRLGLVGESFAAWRMRDALAFIAKTELHALILGASGTGKELAARGIHLLSRRASGPFVARNAATLPPGLIASELFGNLRNYPNPGMPERPGLVGEADGGTLFLDEIGELPTEQQAALLRVLDNGEYQRLGEARTRRSTFRLLGATNRAQSSLKHDLAARLTARLEMASLAERREDIPLLLSHLLRRAAESNPATAGRFVSPSGNGPSSVRIEAALVEYALRADWPTNTRDLDALLWKAIAESTDDALALPMSLRVAAPVARPAEVKAPAIEPDADAIRDALGKNEGNVARAAAALGLSRYALYRLMKKHGIASSEP
jgi:transcriptional regulator with AAA-type ATPase domain